MDAKTHNVVCLAALPGRSVRERQYLDCVRLACAWGALDQYKGQDGGLGADAAAGKEGLCLGWSDAQRGTHLDGLHLREVVICLNVVDERRKGELQQHSEAVRCEFMEAATVQQNGCLTAERALTSAGQTLCATHP